MLFASLWRRFSPGRSPRGELGRQPYSPKYRDRKRTKALSIRLEMLEDRTLPTTVSPLPAGEVGIDPGHLVEFRQASTAQLLTVEDADSLFNGTFASKI